MLRYAADLQTLAYMAAASALLAAHLRHLRTRDRGGWRLACRHYALLSASIGAAIAMDPRKAVLYVLVPQFTALFFLLGANYLQHAHTDEHCERAHSRNFLGLVNPLCFNIGYHSAHHLRGSLHWSLLPALHARIASRIDPRTIERRLGPYLLRVFVLALLLPGLRSTSLRGSAQGTR